MSFSVIPSDKFKKEAKRLLKKYPSLRQELLDLETVLAVKPETGTPLGNGTYKIRVAVKSKGKGKSGGARIIAYVVTPNKEVYLLTIYDKSEFSQIEDRMIGAIIKTLSALP